METGKKYVDSSGAVYVLPQQKEAQKPFVDSSGAVYITPEAGNTAKQYEFEPTATENLILMATKAAETHPLGRIIKQSLEGNKVEWMQTPRELGGLALEGAKGAGETLLTQPISPDPLQALTNPELMARPAPETPAGSPDATDFLLHLIPGYEIGKTLVKDGPRAAEAHLSEKLVKDPLGALFDAWIIKDLVISPVKAGMNALKARKFAAAADAAEAAATEALPGTDLVLARKQYLANRDAVFAGEAKPIPKALMSPGLPEPAPQPALGAGAIPQPGVAPAGELPAGANWRVPGPKKPITAEGRTGEQPALTGGVNFIMKKRGFIRNKAERETPPQYVTPAEAEKRFENVIVRKKNEVVQNEIKELEEPLYELQQEISAARDFEKQAAATEGGRRAWRTEEGDYKILSGKSYPDFISRNKINPDRAVSVIKKALDGEKMTASESDLFEIIKREAANRPVKKQEVITGDLRLGDEFKIGGEKFKVKKGDEPGTIKVVDGETYVLDDTFDKIKIDKGKEGINRTHIASDQLDIYGNVIEMAKKKKAAAKQQELFKVQREMPTGGISGKGEFDFPKPAPKEQTTIASAISEKRPTFKYSAKDLTSSGSREEIQGKLQEMFGTYDDLEKIENKMYDGIATTEEAKKLQVANDYMADIEYAANARDTAEVEALLNQARADLRKPLRDEEKIREAFVTKEKAAKEEYDKVRDERYFPSDSSSGKTKPLSSSDKVGGPTLSFMGAQGIYEAVKKSTDKILGKGPIGKDFKDFLKGKGGVPEEAAPASRAYIGQETLKLEDTVKSATDIHNVIGKAKEVRAGDLASLADKAIKGEGDAWQTLYERNPGLAHKVRTARQDIDTTIDALADEIEKVVRAGELKDWEAFKQSLGVDFKGALKGKVKGTTEASKTITPKSLVEIMRKSKGSYVRRKYLANMVENYAPTEAQWKKAIDAMVGEEKVTPAQARSTLQSILDGKQALYHDGYLEAMISKSPYMRRANIPEYLKEFLGEIKDPALNYVLTQKDLTANLTKMKLFDELSKDGKIFFDKPTGKSTVKIEDALKVSERPDAYAWGSIADKYTTREMADFLGDMKQIENVYDRALFKALSVTKATKTVFNPPTHLKNVLGNVEFSIMADCSVTNPLNAKYYKQAFDALTGKNDALRRKLIENGVIHREYSHAEIVSTAQKLHELGIDTGSWIKNAYRKAEKAASEVYAAEDQIFKAASWIKQTEKGMSPRAATTHVYNNFPNYAEVSRFTEKVRSGYGGFMFPFISFDSESYRIFAGAIKAGGSRRWKALGLASWRSAYNLSYLTATRGLPLGAALKFMWDNDLFYSNLMVDKKRKLTARNVGAFDPNIFNVKERLSGSRDMVLEPAKKIFSTKNDFGKDKKAKDYAVDVAKSINTTAGAIAKGVTAKRGERVETFLKQASPFKVKPLATIGEHLKAKRERRRRK